MHSLGIVQWNFTRRDHPGNPRRVSGSGPVTETLIIHINQCIHIVLAFIGNARQSILHLKYCFQQKFYFRKFHF